MRGQESSAECRGDVDDGGDGDGEEVGRERNEKEDKLRARVREYFDGVAAVGGDDVADVDVDGDVDALG